LGKNSAIRLVGWALIHPKHEDQTIYTRAGKPTVAYGPDVCSVKSPTAVFPLAAPAVDRRMNFLITGGV
jgi:hypothetical protein